MGIENAIITRSQPGIMNKMMMEVISDEIIKGCSSEISNFPVTLEPNFFPIWTIKNIGLPDHQGCFIPEDRINEKDILRAQIWISPDQEFDWRRSEIFIKQCQSLLFTTGFEIVGNSNGIIIGLLCHRIDYPKIYAAFKGTFEYCELTVVQNHPFQMLSYNSCKHIRFYDFFPSPPYSHLLTSPNEFNISPFQILISTISQMQTPEIGFYQVLFKSVSMENDWHRNVEVLLDYEYAIKLNNGSHAFQRYAQQSPSGDLRNMANEVEIKAHNDKPFFSTVIRLGVANFRNMENASLESLSTMMNLFQHGGRPLRYITESDYFDIIPNELVKKMLLYGQTYRPGFLVNSWELSGPVHIPPIKINESQDIQLEGLTTFRPDISELNQGTFIGTHSYAGEKISINIPDIPRSQGIHIIGKPGIGKSTLEERVILEDIAKGHGVAVLDPHGDLIESLLDQIPEEHVDRTIYLNPGIPDQIPIWNPIKRIPGMDIGRSADDIVKSIQSFVTSGSWGDRMEHILRNIVFSVMHLPNGTFLDIYNLLQNKSDESDSLRKEILKIVDNETVRSFWLNDYGKYRKDDFGPPRNKLSKLLTTDPLSLMLSQPDSKFNFHEIMDQSKILLVDLSQIGNMLREVLGCFILATLYLSAVRRSSIPKHQRKPFHIHCDEAHRFITDSLEDIIAETRKFGVSLTLAHQYLKQFSHQKTDAFLSIGSTIIFNVNKQDANELSKGLQNKATVNDLITLKRGEAIARVGLEIVKIETPKPSEVRSKTFKEKIISESLKKYYRPAHEIKKLIQNRGQRWNQAFTSLDEDFNDIKDFGDGGYEFDEFD